VLIFSVNIKSCYSQERYETLRQVFDFELRALNRRMVDSVAQLAPGDSRAN
jgi:hypothetical protein